MLPVLPLSKASRGSKAGDDGGGPTASSQLRDLMDFTTRIVRYILQSEDRERFLANIRSRVCLRTMYSGIGSEGIAMHWILKALRTEGVLEQDAARDQELFVWHSACDRSSLAQKVLLACGASSGPSHIFRDILDRHSEKTRRELDTVRWPSNLSPAKKRRLSATPSPQVAPARPSEDDDCVIISSTALQPDSAVQISAQDNTSEGLSVALDAIYETNKILRTPEAYRPDDAVYCCKHKAWCCVQRSEGSEGSSSIQAASSCRAGIHMVTGGLTCIDFSRIGAQAGYEGPSTKPALSFCGTFRADGVDIGIVECAPGWDASLCVASLEGSHTLVDREPKPCPSRFGWPFTRLRYYGLVLKNGHKLMKSWGAFSKPFEKPVSLTGHDFFVDAPAAVAQQMKEAMRRVGSELLPGETPSYETHGLTGSQATFLRNFREAHQEKVQDMRRRNKEVPKGMDMLICDLQHNPDQRLRMSVNGSIIGLLTHGTMWSDAARRPLTKREILSLQGWPTIPSEHGDKYEIPWAALIEESSAESLTKLSGNGMHMNVLVLILCWALACTELASASESAAPAQE